MAIGILSNPLSGKVKNHLADFRKLAKTIQGGIYREAAGQSEFKRVLDEFSKIRIDLLVIIAGDGTVHAVLSYLLKSDIFLPLPMLAIVPAGTTNMTAKDFHFRGAPMKVFRRLTEVLTGPGPYPFIRRHIMRIQHGDDVPHYGLFFGLGMITEGVRYSHKRVKKYGVTGERASALVLLRYLLHLLTGGRGNVAVSLGTDCRESDHNETDRDYLLIFVTSLDRLLLGLRPYWGREQQPLHLTQLRSLPRKLWRSILPMLTGRGADLSEDNGYISHNVSQLRLAFTGDFVVDGEIYMAERSRGPVYISAHDVISVIDIRV